MLYSFQYAYSPHCSLYISQGADRENLFADIKVLFLVIIPFILITLMCDSGLILWMMDGGNCSDVQLLFIKSQTVIWQWSKSYGAQNAATYPGLFRTLNIGGTRAIQWRKWPKNYKRDASFLAAFRFRTQARWSSTISEKTSIYVNFLSVYQPFEHATCKLTTFHKPFIQYQNR